MDETGILSEQMAQLTDFGNRGIPHGWAWLESDVALRASDVLLDMFIEKKQAIDSKDEFLQFT